jgi:hypothetical protein
MIKVKVIVPEYDDWKSGKIYYAANFNKMNFNYIEYPEHFLSPNKQVDWVNALNITKDVTVVTNSIYIAEGLIRKIENESEKYETLYSDGLNETDNADIIWKLFADAMKRSDNLIIS